MRAEEFLKESATTGSTASGNVATVVKPLTKGKKQDQTFFGGNTDDFPAYGDTNVVLIRRPSPVTKIKTKRG